MKKCVKFLSTVIAVSMALSALPLVASAEDDAAVSSVATSEIQEDASTVVEQGNTETQNLQDDQPQPSPESWFYFDNGTITGFNTGAEGFDINNVVVPYSIGGQDVTALKSTNDEAHMTGAENIKNIDLSLCTSLKTIDDYAFYRCYNLESVIFKHIGDQYSVNEYAFAFCYDLKSVDLSNCKELGKCAFYDCVNLTEVNAPLVTEIPLACFSGCYNLKYFNKDEEKGIDFSLEGIEYFDYDAFMDCTSAYPTIFTNTDISDIEKYAFSNVPYITLYADNEKDLSNFCDEIGYAMFDDYKGLYDVATIGILADSNVNISYDGNQKWNGGSTYYITASLLSEYNAYDGYENVDAYNIKLNRIDNTDNHKQTYVSCSGLPITVSLDDYNAQKAYYFSSDSSVEPTEELTLTKNKETGKYDTNAVSVDISENGSDIAVLFKEYDGPFTIRDNGDDTITITGLNKDSKAFPADGKVAVPEKINGRTVTAIDIEQTWGMDKVTSLDLSACTGLKYIGGYVGLKNRGNGAFTECANLKSVTFPTGDGVSYTIDDNAFKDTPIEGNIDLSNCTSVGAYVFKNCAGLTGDVDLTNCMSIGNYAFSGCTNIVNVDLSNCTSIGDYAFYNCIGITGNIDLSNCTYIGYSSFKDCHNIKPTVSTKTKKICNYAFANDIPYVTIQAENEADLVEYCGNITDGRYGLMYVKKVGILSDIPSDISVDMGYVVDQIVEKCSDTDYTYYLKISSTDGYIVNKTTNNGFEGVEDYINVGNAYNFEFKSVEYDADYSQFANVADGIPITFSLNSDEYDSEKEYFCYSQVYDKLTGLTFTEDKETGKNVSNTVSIDTTNTGDFAEVVYIDASIFTCNYNDDGTVTITGVDENSTYFPADGKIVVPEKINGKTVTAIDIEQTWGMDKVTSLDLSVCTNLTYIGGGVLKNRGNGAFTECVNLKSVTFPTGDGVSYTIDDNAFKGTPIEGNIDLSNCTSVGDSAFENCAGLTGDVDLTNCTSIGDYAFSGCTNIVNVYLSNCTSIGDCAFAECTNVVNIDLSNCTSVGETTEQSAVTETAEQNDDTENTESIIETVKEKIANATPEEIAEYKDSSVIKAVKEKLAEKNVAE